MTFDSKEETDALLASFGVMDSEQLSLKKDRETTIMVSVPFRGNGF